MFIFICLLSLLVFTSCAAQNHDHSSGWYPDSTWYQFASPEDAGWSSEGVAKARALADSLGAKAVMLIYDGAIVSEWGNTRELAPIQSIRKSLFSALIGIAVHRGQVDTSMTIAELGINDTPPLMDSEKQAKVIHLLTTSSSIYHLAAYESPGARKPERGSEAPGTRWYYNNWDFNALGTIYEQQTGDRIFEAFKEQIADPIGMEDYHPDWGGYMLQPNRSEHPAYNLWMTAHDMARFGLLYLREGRWKEKQVVPASWVQSSRQIHVEVPYDFVAGYGLSWWIRGGELQQYGAYLASGAGSQLIMILPEIDIVYVFRASSILERGVNGLEAGEILIRLLEARTGEADANSTLVPVVQ